MPYVLTSLQREGRDGIYIHSDSNRCNLLMCNLYSLHLTPKESLYFAVISEN